MAKTYRELLDDRKKLDEEIKEARKAEVSSVVATIKGWIEEFELTADELGFKSVSKKVSVITSTDTSDGTVDKRSLPPKPKFANPNNPSQTWSGKGAKDKRPLWVREFIAAGGDIEKCRIPE